MFDKMKQLYEMQKQAKEMKKTVEALKVQKASADGAIKVVMNGSFKLEGLEIGEEWLKPEKKSALESTLKTLISEAAEEAGKLSAQEAMAMMKGLNLPGM